MFYKKNIWLGLLLILSIMSVLFSLCYGSIHFSLSEVLSFFGENESTVAKDIFLQLRLPRTLNAFVTGALLAISGAIMQALLRNPLADPYILGVSGGAAVAALSSMLLGFTGFLLTASTWAGGLAAMLLVYLLACQKHWQNEKVILTGVACASCFSALISLILMISPDKNLHSLLFWLLGDLSIIRFPFFESILLILGLIWVWLMAKNLNLLSWDELKVNSLGMNIKLIQNCLYFICAILTAAAVSLAGCIGFIGLIVPHLVRLLMTHDYRWLLPACFLLGGSLLTVADTLSRVLFFPQQLPVGIMTTLIGIPIFLILLHTSQ